MHAVALRLKGGRRQVGGDLSKRSRDGRPQLARAQSVSIVPRSQRCNLHSQPKNGPVATELRSNAMQKPRTPVRGTVQRRCRSCEATACVPPISDHNNSDRRFEHVAAGIPGGATRVAPLGLEDHQHTPFHGLTPMATSYRRSAAESQNTRPVGRKTGGQRANPSSWLSIPIRRFAHAVALRL